MALYYSFLVTICYSLLQKLNSASLASLAFSSSTQCPVFSRTTVIALEPTSLACSGSKDAFFYVVDIKEKLYLTRRLAELWNVLNEILLHLIRKIAQAFANHFIIPTDDRQLIFLGGILT